MSLFYWECSSCMFLAIYWFNSCHYFIAASIVILHIFNLFWSSHFCDPSPDASLRVNLSLSRLSFEIFKPLIYKITKARHEGRENQEDTLDARLESSINLIPYATLLKIVEVIPMWIFPIVVPFIFRPNIDPFYPIRLRLSTEIATDYGFCCIRMTIKFGAVVVWR